MGKLGNEAIDKMCTHKKKSLLKFFIPLPLSSLNVYMYQSLYFYGNLSYYYIIACKCIRITNLVVPEVVNEKSDVTLRCQFALQGSELYSAKWYRDGKEFYRYAPRDSPPAQVFVSGGVTVDVSNFTFIIL